MTNITSWTIPGAEQQPIYGNTHQPDVEPRGAIVIAHGFKGYKDYGMFPLLAKAFADAGFIAHRFNFSHSGMTNETETFARPDLFEKDTWNKQVSDLRAVVEAMTRGEIAGGDVPYMLFGHSRGGVSVLLTAGRFADDVSVHQPSGVVSAAAPARCNPFTDEQAEQLLRDGYIESPSNRTGQTLRVGKAYLQEQLDDPEAHDVCRLIGNICCPVLLLQGENDPTVAPEQARTLWESANADVFSELKYIRGADHVFNTPNPPPSDHARSPQLQDVIDEVLRFAKVCCQPSEAQQST